MTSKRHSITVTFSDDEWYVMEKLVNARGETPEQYLHDLAVVMFECDIYDVFGIQHPMYKELLMAASVLRRKMP